MIVILTCQTLRYILARVRAFVARVRALLSGLKLTLKKVCSYFCLLFPNIKQVLQLVGGSNPSEKY